MVKASHKSPSPKKPDFEENPEWTEEDFKKALPASEFLTENLPLHRAEELLKPKRGRPKSDNPKEQVTLRIDADVLEAFRSRGSGWQTRMNEVLKRHVDEA